MGKGVSASRRASTVPSCALVVFAKVPVPGTVKTRLVPPLTHAQAAALYTAFLTDALASFVRASAESAVRLYLPPSSASMPDGVVPPGVSMHVQHGDGLGARMDAALSETLAAGYGRAVVIGTDHPTLPLAHLARAFDALTVPGTVTIGPSDDGGFYLLGLDQPRPELFDGMTYSHDRVFEQTRTRALACTEALHLLPAWYDVDDAASLARLLADVNAGASIGPYTAEALREVSLETAVRASGNPPPRI